MKKILILSGKGGTGKTTVAASLIEYLNSKTIADCDVDAPNLHLLLKVKNPVEKDFIGSKKALIDVDKCISCGLCAEKCRFDAIHSFGSSYKVDEISCEGCTMCSLVCPAGAVSFYDDKSGTLQKYTAPYDFSTACLKLGRGNSGKLVSEVKRNMVIKNTEEYAVLDGSPGIGCPVIASISGVDWVLLVAEPTLSGFSDLKRIVSTAKAFDLNMALCVNKSDINMKITNEIIDYCKDEGVYYLGLIPYDKAVLKALKSCKLIINVPSEAGNALRNVFKEFKQVLENEN